MFGFSTSARQHRRAPNTGCAAPPPWRQPLLSIRSLQPDPSRDLLILSGDNGARSDTAGLGRRQWGTLADNGTRLATAGPGDEASPPRASSGSGRQTANTASASDSRTTTAAVTTAAVNTGTVWIHSHDTDVSATTSRSRIRHRPTTTRSRHTASQRQPHAVLVTHAPMTQP